MSLLCCICVGRFLSLSLGDVAIPFAMMKVIGHDRAPWIAEMLGDEELTRAEAQIARSRAVARLERAEAEIAAATVTSPLAGIVDTPDPAAVWAGDGRRADAHGRRRPQAVALDDCVVRIRRPVAAGHGGAACGEGQPGWDGVVAVARGAQELVAVNLTALPADPLFWIPMAIRE